MRVRFNYSSATPVGLVRRIVSTSGCISSPKRSPPKRPKRAAGMSSKRIVRAFLVGVCLLAMCAAPERVAANNCADGGRPRPDEGGVGGTGRQQMVPDDEGGIGGTGVSARGDTGIIGTITGFASICVGGVEIRYAADTPVRVDGRGATS